MITLVPCANRSSARANSTAYPPAPACAQATPESSSADFTTSLSITTAPRTRAMARASVLLPDPGAPAICSRKSLARLASHRPFDQLFRDLLKREAGDEAD